jgi:hypothetical protein
VGKERPILSLKPLALLLNFTIQGYQESSFPNVWKRGKNSEFSIAFVEREQSGSLMGMDTFPPS